MRVAYLGMAVFAVLGIVVLGTCLSKTNALAQNPNFSQPVQEQREAPPTLAVAGAQEGLIVLHLDGAPNHPLVALIDARKRVMSVYQVDSNTGEIRLKSVRNVDWDLQLDEFNGTSPSPREIQSLLQHR